jgi:hypothetical protein
MKHITTNLMSFFESFAFLLTSLFKQNIILYLSKVITCLFDLERPFSDQKNNTFRGLVMTSNSIFLPITLILLNFSSGTGNTKMLSSFS